jgi:quercetin dioxygenase-like cupin family protein
MNRRAATLLAAALLAAGPTSPGVAQPAAVAKTILQDQDFPPPAHHTITVRTVVRHGGVVAPHTHPGVEMGYVLSGAGVLSVAGRADLTLSAGGSFAILPRTVHSVRNTGPGDLTMISTYVVEKNQPIATPAP